MAKLLLALLLTTLPLPCAPLLRASGADTAPQRQQDLDPMLEITWTR